MAQSRTFWFAALLEAVLVAAALLALGACASGRRSRPCPPGSVEIGVGGCGSLTRLQPGEGAALSGLAADVATTAMGLHSDNLREANPLYGNGDNALLAMTAVNVALHYATRWMLRNAPPRQQKRVWRVVSAIHFGAAGWNAVQLAQAGGGGAGGSSP